MKIYEIVFEDTCVEVERGNMFKHLADAERVCDDLAIALETAGISTFTVWVDEKEVSGAEYERAIGYDIQD